MNKDQALDTIRSLLAIINSLEVHEVTCSCAIFQAPESIIDDMDIICTQARQILKDSKP